MLRALFSVVGVGLILKGVVHALFFAVVMGVAGYVAFSHGPGASQHDHGFWVQMLLFLLIVPLYTLSGLVGGVLAAVAGTLSRESVRLEEGLLKLLDPAMSWLMDRLFPPGATEMPREEFLPRLDEKVRQAEADSTWGAGFSRRIGLRLFRFFLAQEMVESLARQGEDRVTGRGVERFVREQGVGLIRETVQDQLALVRYAIWIVWGMLGSYTFYTIQAS
ncbi:MAG: hypothetical protein HQL51_05690 [Magnetococcales bacterium]|nr:hypothetical protein [Magnetococcales bacterium]